MEFRPFIRTLAVNKRCLEIGPSYNPVITRGDGFDVTVFDHADGATLREKYEAFGVDVSRIGEVDHIGTDIGQLIGQVESFDLIIASHLIEHTPDFITFLSHASQLLSEDGVLAIIVPDKRFSFDVFRPLTTAGQMIDANLANRRGHAGALFDHYANFVYKGEQMAWGTRDASPFRHIHDAADGARMLGQVTSRGEYIDAHEWVFTPHSFRLVCQDLYVAGLINLGERHFHTSHGYEFLTVLARNEAPCQLSRPELQREVALEEIQSMAAVLSCDPLPAEYREGDGNAVMSIMRVMHEQQGQVPDLVAQCKALDCAMTDSASALAETKETLADTQLQLARAGKHSEELAERLRLADLKLASANGDLAEIRGSRSWSMTAPIRKIVSRLRGHKP